VQFSEELTVLAQELSQMMQTNRTELTKAIKSLETSSGALQRIVQSVEQGKGLAGALINNPELKDRIDRITANLETATSNITRHGLLYKPKQPKPDTASRPFRGKPTY
jgi:predicted transcriptional regulator